MPSNSPGRLGTQEDVILPRVGAFVVDHMISFVVAVVVGLAVGLTLESMALVYLGVFVGLFGYFIVLEAWTGQTIGKKLFGVVVVTEYGEPIGLEESLIRNLLRFVDGILNYAVGLVVMLVSDDRKRIGDHAAGTIVVRVRR